VADECLSDDQIAAVREAPPGGAPPGLAQHLSACERCQSRALFGAVRSPGLKREPPALPSPARALALLLLIVLAMAAFLWTLRQLTG
jgi:hypothetical protein